MCVNPLYLKNPLLKKIEEDKEIDIRKLYRFNNFKIKRMYHNADGSGKVVTLPNYVDMSIYGDRFKGYFVPEYIKCPCGVCYQCCRQKVNQMVSRMQIELENHSNFGFFLTLTYDDLHLPLNYVDEETGELFEHGVPTLCKLDVQKFLKRLRINLSRDGHDISLFKYFYISEYGMSNTDNKRPHYHMMIFFDKLPVNVFYDYVSESWKLGNIKVDVINESRMRYCANSHATASKLFPNNTGSVKPFSHWSKGFGLPLSSDTYNYVRSTKKVSVNGNVYPIDRYMREKLFTKDEIKTYLKFSSNCKDDYLVSLEDACKRLFPRVRSLESLTPEQLKRCKQYVKSSEDNSQQNYYNRYVIKRK